MTCYACGKEATQRCPRCAKPYCQEHGDDLCAACQDPATAIPSSMVFRGSLLALLVASILALWLLIRPPGLPEEGGQEAALPPATVTPAALATTPISPSPTATPKRTATATPAPTGTPTRTPTGTATGTVSPTPAASPTAAASPTPSPTPKPSPFTEYEVQQGDSLSAIASRFGTTINDLVTINGLSSQDVILSVGQVLLVPAQPTPTPTPPSGGGLPP